jgi:hypothetical protein
LIGWTSPRCVGSSRTNYWPLKVPNRPQQGPAATSQAKAQPWLTLVVVPAGCTHTSLALAPSDATNSPRCAARHTPRRLAGSISRSLPTSVMRAPPILPSTSSRPRAALSREPHAASFILVARPRPTEETPPPRPQDGRDRLYASAVFAGWTRRGRSPRAWSANENWKEVTRTVHRDLAMAGTIIVLAKHG